VLRDSVVNAFARAALSPDPDLAVAALMIARIEYPSLDSGPYLDQLDAIGREARRRVAEARPSLDTPAEVPPQIDADGYARVVALNDYLFGELRFVGNDRHYEDPRNSFLNEVIDRRTGIPITLAVVLVEVCRQARLAARGVSFPGHFLVRIPLREGVVLVDPFSGTALGRQELRALHVRSTGIDADPDPRLLAPATNRQILTRMLNNLRGVYTARKDQCRLDRVLAYLDALGEARGVRVELGASGGRPMTPGGHVLN